MDILIGKKTEDKDYNIVWWDGNHPGYYFCPYDSNDDILCLKYSK